MFRNKKPRQVFDTFGQVPFFAALFCSKLSEGMFCVDLGVNVSFLRDNVLREIER